MTKKKKQKRSNKQELSPFQKEKINLIQELYDMGLDPKKTTIRTNLQSFGFERQDFINYHNHRGHNTKVLVIN